MTQGSVLKVCSREEAKALDQVAIREFGIPAAILMEDASLAATACLEREVGISGKRFLVLCGSGNNGGDGLALSRHLYSRRGNVSVCLLGQKKSFSEDGEVSCAILERMAVSIHLFKEVSSLLREIQEVDVVIDALFGVGLNRCIDGVHREVIEAVNTSSTKVLSLDIPSGVCSDTGEALGACIQADWTVSFGVPKWGNLLYPGFASGGKLFFSHISYPLELQMLAELKGGVNLPPPLPHHDPCRHKKQYGQILTVAGSPRYRGAPLFSAASVLKSGGGFSCLATPASLVPHLASVAPEVVYFPQRETKAGVLSPDAFEEILALANVSRGVILGPGLSRENDVQKLVCELVPQIEIPLILDGDGLFAIAGALEEVRARRAPTLLTPHEGEAGRLLGREGKPLPARKRILEELVARYACMVILKGAHSLIGFPDGTILINVTGNEGMATAGSGDLLNGVIMGVFSLGVSFEEAVRIGVLIHGVAGDKASRKSGMDSVTASDIFSHLPEAMSSYRSNHDWISAKCCEVLSLL